MQRREGAAGGGRRRRKEGAEEGGWAPGREGALRREGSKIGVVVEASEVRREAPGGRGTGGRFE